MYFMEKQMKKMISITFIPFLAIGIGGCLSLGGDGKERVKQKISVGALVVDVRTPEEFARGHYKGAINIPLSEVPRRLSEFGAKEKPIVVYCRSGNRSGKAKSILLKNGFIDVTNGGGFRDMERL